MRVEGYAGYLERAILGERDEAMRHPAFQLPKIILPRTRVNKATRRAGAPRFGDSDLDMAPPHRWGRLVALL
jgi:hypothetical protein